MSSTSQLDRVRRVAERDGAKLLWTGDPEQTDSPGAGGALRLIGDRNGSYLLGQQADDIRRFHAPWEREASLGLRAGSTEALRAYDEHGRIVEGTREEVSDHARRGWLADHLAGKRTLLMVGTNNEATTQSADLRQQLVAWEESRPAGSDSETATSPAPATSSKPVRTLGTSRTPPPADGWPTVTCGGSRTGTPTAASPCG